MVRKNSLRSFCLLLTHDRKFGLDDNTVDFIGHALALHRDDRYLNEPALDTVKRMKVSVLDNYELVILSELWVLLNWKLHLFHLDTQLYFVCLFMGLYFLLVVICRVSCTISRGIALHISFVWFRRASPGIPVYICLSIRSISCWECSVLDLFCSWFFKSLSFVGTGICTA